MKVYYNIEWDIIGVSIDELNGETMLFTSELDKKIFRVLTNKWLLIGKV